VETKVNVNFLLHNTEQGKKFMKKIKSMKDPLTIEQKKMLCLIISGYYVENNLKLETKHMTKFAIEIASIFSAENPTTYVSTNCKGGMLYNKYHNLNYKLRRLDPDYVFVQKRKGKQEKMETEDSPYHPTAEEKTSDDYVRNNAFDQSRAFYKHWDDSVNFRKFNISAVGSNEPINDILLMYPSYGRPDGWTLVSKDNKT
jgi:hypothetical protein